MEGVHTILVDSNKKFSALVKRPEKLLLKEHDLIDRTKLLTKVIYDVSKLLEPSPCLKTLPELIVDGFDCEQVNLSLDTKMDMAPIITHRYGLVLNSRTRPD